MRRVARLAVATLALALAAASAWAAPWSRSSAQLGAQEHPKIVAESGGALTGPLADYVARVGRGLVRHTDRADARWTFTVLDSPVVNAFALPGGYVYITRGLLALTNSEAELAAVLGHEIGHVVEGHGETRMRKSNEVGIGVVLGTILGGVLGGQDGARLAHDLGGLIGSGVLAQYSQKQEFAADSFGVRLIARAGYDPMAAASILAQLQANDAFQARIAGRQGNPNRVDFFATHPSTPQRVARAAREARAAGRGGRVDANAFLRRLDGLIYGDNPREGLVRGTTFIHPELRFRLQVPDGYTLHNTPTRLAATDGRGGVLLLTGGEPWRGRLDGYIDRIWVPQIARQVRITDYWDLRRTTINGLEAATARIGFVNDAGRQDGVLVALRHRGAIYQIAVFAPAGHASEVARLARAAGSFRPISAAEAARVQPWRIRIHRVRAGETIASLAEKMGDRRYGVELFRLINGIGRGERPVPGQLVKLVR